MIGFQQSVHRIDRIAKRSDRGPEALDVILRVLEGIRNFPDDFPLRLPHVVCCRVQYFCNAFGYHADKAAVYFALYCRNSLVRNFGRNRVFLFVDVIFYLRALQLARDDARQVCAEILRNDDRRVIFSAFHTVFGVVFVGKCPAHLCILLEVCDNFIAAVKLKRVEAEAPVLIDNRYLDTVGASVRVPVRRDIEPCVQSGNHADTDDNDERNRIARQTF